MREAIQAIWQQYTLRFVAIAIAMLYNAAAIVLFLLLGAFLVFLAEFLTPPESIGNPDLRSFRMLVMDAARTFAVMGFAILYGVSVVLDAWQIITQRS